MVPVSEIFNDELDLVPLANSFWKPEDRLGCGKSRQGKDFLASSSVYFVMKNFLPEATTILCLFDFLFVCLFCIVLLMLLLFLTQWKF